MFCCSGERTSAKDWPGILEIKGRVRLDAFEKFLQELPLSRSRAVMVSLVYFCCTIVSDQFSPLKFTPWDINELKQKMKEQRIVKLFFNVFPSNLFPTVLGILGSLLSRRMFWATIHVFDCEENTISFVFPPISIGSHFRAPTYASRIILHENLKDYAFIIISFKLHGKLRVKIMILFILWHI